MYFCQSVKYDWRKPRSALRTTQVLVHEGISPIKVCHTIKLVEALLSRASRLLKFCVEVEASEIEQAHHIA